MSDDLTLRLLISFGLVLCTAFAEAARRPWATEELAELELTLRESSNREHSATNLLWRHIEDNEHSPGLVFLGKAMRHELETAEKLGKLLNDRFGYKFILIASWGEKPIPAYDGLIMDRDNKVLANVSMKRFQHAEPNSMLKKTKRAFGQMESYSTAEKWARHIVDNSEWKAGKDDLGNIIANFGFSNERRHEQFKQMRSEVVFIALLFAVESKRPRWVVTQVDDASQLTNEGLGELAELTSEGARTNLIFHNDQFTLLKNGKVRQGSLELADCGASLKGP